MLNLANGNIYYYRSYFIEWTSFDVRDRFGVSAKSPFGIGSETR